MHELGFDASEEELFTMDGTQPDVSEDYLENMHLWVEQFVQHNNLILKMDYYK